MNNGRPDDKNPMANVLHSGQQNVTDIGSLVDLMRSAELSLIGRSDLLGIRSEAMFQSFSNHSFVEQLTAANRQRSVDTVALQTQQKDDRKTMAANNKLTASDSSNNDRLDIDKIFTGILDLKITSADMNGFYAAAGPPFTVDRTEVEPFQWSESSIRYLPHYGHPDIWDYDLEGINWVWNWTRETIKKTVVEPPKFQHHNYTIKSSLGIFTP